MGGNAGQAVSLVRVAVGLLAAGAHVAQAKALEVTSLGECHYGTKGYNPTMQQIHQECPPPTTDKSPTRAGTPWTHTIRCLVAKNETLKTQKTYCLYTDSLYGNGHGASIIVSPYSASDLIGHDAYEDRPAYGGSGKRVYKSGPIVTAQGPAYSIGPTPGKGLGLIAKRKIGKGEIFMLDFPALLVGKQFIENTPPKLRRRLLKRGISQLPQETQDKVFSLAKSTGGQAIDDILGTNTCSVVLGDKEVMLGLYPEVARINHACNPNSYYRFSPRTLVMETVAYRDIQPGEEITISYTQLILSRHARREFLQENWNFNCKCSLCRAHTEEVTASEDNRKDMRKLQLRLVDATRNGEYQSALEAATKLVDITNSEGVTPIVPEMHDIMAAIYLDMKDWSNALRYGRMALDEWYKFDSVDSYQLESAQWFLKYVEDMKRQDV